MEPACAHALGHGLHAAFRLVAAIWMVQVDSGLVYLWRKSWLLWPAVAEAKPLSESFFDRDKDLY
jgi:hypothetical protein